MGENTVLEIKTMPPEFLSAPMTARFLGIGKSTAYKLKSMIPHYRIPGITGISFKRRDLESMMEQNRVDPITSQKTNLRERIEFSCQRKESAHES